MKALEGLPRKVQLRVESVVHALELDPRPSGAKKLAGEDGLYRVRSGD